MPPPKKRACSNLGYVGMFGDENAVSDRHGRKVGASQLWGLCKHAYSRRHQWFRRLLLGPGVAAQKYTEERKRGERDRKHF